jgi:acyl carrier protein
MPFSRSRIRVAVIGALGEITRRPTDRMTDADALVEELGLDSLNMASFIVAVEERLGARVSDGDEAELVDAKTVGDILDRLERIFGPESP